MALKSQIASATSLSRERTTANHSPKLVFVVDEAGSCSGWNLYLRAFNHKSKIRVGGQRITRPRGSRQEEINDFDVPFSGNCFFGRSCLQDEFSPFSICRVSGRDSYLLVCGDGRQANVESSPSGSVSFSFILKIRSLPALMWAGTSTCGSGGLVLCNGHYRHCEYQQQTHNSFQRARRSSIEINVGHGVLPVSLRGTRQAPFASVL